MKIFTMKSLERIAKAGGHHRGGPVSICQLYFRDHSWAAPTNDHDPTMFLFTCLLDVPHLLSFHSSALLFLYSLSFLPASQDAALPTKTLKYTYKPWNIQTLEPRAYGKQVAKQNGCIAQKSTQVSFNSLRVCLDVIMWLHGGFRRRFGSQVTTFSICSASWNIVPSVFQSKKSRDHKEC